MEKWLHFGIDKKSLKVEFKEFLNLKFPDIPEDDELYDLYSELVLLDSHIVGLVSSYLEDKRIKLNLLDADYEFNILSSNINIKSKPLDELLKRKEHIDKLVKMIKMIESSQ